MPENFDTLAFSNTLIRGGFTREQAEEMASAMFQLIDSQLVTRDYLDLRLAQLKTEWLQYTFGAVVLQSGITAVLFKLLH